MGERHTAAVTTTAPVDTIQRHVLSTLVMSQMLGGVGLSAGVAVGALVRLLLGVPARGPDPADDAAATATDARRAA